MTEEYLRNHIAEYRARRLAIPKRARSKPFVRQTRQPPGPGDLVKFILTKLGITYGPDGVRCPNGTRIGACGCEAMRRRMNDLGWRGCVRNRREIIAWFTDKANKCGIAVDSASVAGLVRAGLREAVSQWRGAKRCATC